MMIDWNKYHQQFGARWRIDENLADTSRLPDTERRQFRHHQTRRKNAAIDSLAVAVTTSATDASSITRSGAKAGASREEIAEASELRSR